MNLSHITLNVHNNEKLKETIDFYKNIGFKELEAHNHSNNNFDKDDIWMYTTGNKENLINLKISTNEDSKKSSDVEFTFNIKPTQLKNLESEVLTDPLGNRLKLTNYHPLSSNKNNCNFLSDTSNVENYIGEDHHSEDFPQTNTVDINKKKYRIAVLTSGGDSQGMNCAVRSVVRTAIYKGHEPYVIMEGYQGLVEGKDKIKKINWGDVRRFLHISGTVIGSARCKEFRTIEGRRKAALNLINNGIDMLVVIGGDGTLTGADLFRSEFSSHVENLFNEKLISEKQKVDNKELRIVGIVGSIDNDMAMTDLTIGAASCLNRICESVDNILSTAISHQRVFIVEVMGRNCGWLALMAAICTSADFVLVPEQPPKEGWEKSMCDRITKARELGKRASIIIVSEGAIDSNLNPIKAEYIKDTISKEIGLEARTTFLGHVQRGGNPCAMDRILGTIQGIKAVEVLLDAKPGDDSLMVNVMEGTVNTYPLVNAVQKTKDASKAISMKKFDECMDQRDHEFKTMWNIYKNTSFLKTANTPKKDIDNRPNIAIMHVGAPSAGMNAASLIITRLCISNNCTPLAIRNGFEGLLKDEVEQLSWKKVGNWMPRGGSELGTNRKMPNVDYGLVAYKLQKHGIDALIIIGGFEAFHCIHLMQRKRNEYPIFKIPIINIPATISNNVPNTEYSIGVDTSLNIIIDSCDKLVQSAEAARRRVFIVEVHGGKSGYLATLGGLAAGASKIYTPEDGINLDDIRKDITHTKEKFKHDDLYNYSNVGRLILRTENASNTYSTEMLSLIYNEEGKPLFDSKTAVLGHIQQGGSTSPLDRLRAAKLAYKTFFYIHNILNKENKELKTAAVITINKGETKIVDIEATEKDTDWKNRRHKNCWFKKYKEYNMIMAHYDTSF